MSRNLSPRSTLTRRRPRLTRFSQSSTPSADPPGEPDRLGPRSSAGSSWRTGAPNNLICGAVAARNLDAAGHS